MYIVKLVLSVYQRICPCFVVNFSN